MAPPLAGSKTCDPKCRSDARPINAAVSMGNAISTSTEVTRMPQVKIGSRHIVMPGARMQITVVIMLTPPRMVPRPDTARPMIHRSPPTPGEFSARESGVYAVQPKAAAPLGVKKPDVEMIAQKKYSQYENEFSRGNATSGAPICSGSTKLANPKTTAVA